MCPERVRDMMWSLSLFPPCPDPQAPIRSTDLTAHWRNLERSTSSHHHSACSHFGLPQWSIKQFHALPSGQTPLWTVLPKLGSGCGFQDTQWLSRASQGLSQGSCCISEPSGQWLLLQDPGGMNRRPSASICPAGVNPASSSADLLSTIQQKLPSLFLHLAISSS